MNTQVVTAINTLTRVAIDTTALTPEEILQAREALELTKGHKPVPAHLQDAARKAAWVALRAAYAHGEVAGARPAWAHPDISKEGYEGVFGLNQNLDVLSMARFVVKSTSQAKAKGTGWCLVPGHSKLGDAGTTAVKQRGDANCRAIGWLFLDADDVGPWDDLFTALDGVGAASVRSRSSRHCPTGCAVHPTPVDKWHAKLPLRTAWVPPADLQEARTRWKTELYTGARWVMQTLAGLAGKGFDQELAQLLGRLYVGAPTPDHAGVDRETRAVEGLGFDVEACWQALVDLGVAVPTSRDVHSGGMEWDPADGDAPMVQAFKLAGMYIREISGGKHAVICPWASTHSSHSETGTVLFPSGSFCCSHSHGEGKGEGAMRQVLATLPAAAQRAYAAAWKAKRAADAAADLAAWNAQFETTLTTVFDGDPGSTPAPVVAAPPSEVDPMTFWAEIYSPGDPARGLEVMQALEASAKEYLDLMARRKEAAEEARGSNLHQGCLRAIEAMEADALRANTIERAVSTNPRTPQEQKALMEARMAAAEVTSTGFYRALRRSLDLPWTSCQDPSRLKERGIKSAKTGRVVVVSYLCRKTECDHCGDDVMGAHFFGPLLGPVRCADGTWDLTPMADRTLSAYRVEPKDLHRFRNQYRKAAATDDGALAASVCLEAKAPSSSHGWMAFEPHGEVGPITVLTDIELKLGRKAKKGSYSPKLVTTLRGREQVMAFARGLEQATFAKVEDFSNADLGGVDFFLPSAPAYKVGGGIRTSDSLIGDPQEITKRAAVHPWISCAKHTTKERVAEVAQKMKLEAKIKTSDGEVDSVTVELGTATQAEAAKFEHDIEMDTYAAERKEAVLPEEPKPRSKPMTANSAAFLAYVAPPKAPAVDLAAVQAALLES